ncbi:MAG: SPOR domain-containing protein [Chromatiales bacterium]|jgi:cell division protein FtsN|nr:SPOR domain-containing protein [Chromatiales bacterium]
MARNSKRANKKRSTPTSGPWHVNHSGLLWLASGLILGAVIGSVGYLLPHSRHSEEKEQVAEATTKPAATPVKPAKTPPPPPEPPAKARFEFYTMLPEMEVELSDERIRQAMNAPANAKKSDDGPYILQVGSFRRAEEADGMKARLAFLGIESSVQKVVIGNANIWYRVRLGPYTSMREMGQARSRLQHNDIDFVVLRLGA